MRTVSDEGRGCSLHILYDIYGPALLGEAVMTVSGEGRGCSLHIIYDIYGPALLGEAVMTVSDEGRGCSLPGAPAVLCRSPDTSSPTCRNSDKITLADPLKRQCHEMDMIHASRDTIPLQNNCFKSRMHTV